MSVTTEGWADRALDLRDELVAAGKLSSVEWQAAVLAVPRHELVPTCWVSDAYGRWTVMNTSTEQGRREWLDKVYSNTALVTMIGTNSAGVTTVRSSSSMPSLMTRMLESLDVRDGHRVLEVGTGAGYNAALLCHRLGDDRVFSVDVEPELIELARVRLAKLGYRPTLVARDGARGLPEHAPFDRIIATCAVPAVPWAWIAQTKIGGVVLVDVKLLGQHGSLVRLTRTGPRRAEGRFDPEYGAFMRLRHHPGPYEQPPRGARPDEAAMSRRMTTVDPRTPFGRLVVWFLAGLRIGPNVGLGYSGNDPRGAPRAVFLTTPDGSRCEVDLDCDTRGRHLVREGGPRALWAEVEEADQQWRVWDKPGWDRFGMTVSTGAQNVWLDDPRTPIFTTREERTGP